jgi:hypothetical protein
MEMLDEAGRAHPGFETASIRVGGPVAVARAERGFAHERLSEQADQFLAIDGIHSADDTARTQEEQWRRSRTHSAGDWQLAPEPFPARRCVSGDCLRSYVPTRRCAPGAVLAAYYRDFDQESLAVPHPHRCDRGALDLDDQVPRLAQRPYQLGALALEDLAGQPLQNPAGGGQKHRDATIGAGNIGSPGNTDASRQTIRHGSGHPLGSSIG